MFQKMDVPVLGLIENMSYHLCPDCGRREDIFDHGGVRLAAEKLGVEFLGEIPLQADIRKAADAGLPFAAAEIFKNIAARIWTGLPAEKTAPKAAKA